MVCRMRRTAQIASSLSSDKVALLGLTSPSRRRPAPFYAPRKGGFCEPLANFEAWKLSTDSLRTLPRNTLGIPTFALLTADKCSVAALFRA